MFPKGAVIATAPLSRRLAHPKGQGPRGSLVDLPLMAGMGHFRLPHWEGGHQPWEHPSAGTPQPWAPQLPPHIVVRKGLCQPLEAPPNHPSHPRAPRLRPTSSTLITSPAPSCPCAQQQPWSSPGQGAPPDLRQPFNPTAPQPWASSVGPVGCNTGESP